MKLYADPKSESTIPKFLSLNVYVPRDERFGHLKMSDFLGNGLKSILQFLHPLFLDLCESDGHEFEDFNKVIQLYEGGFKLKEGPLLNIIFENIPLQLLKQILPLDDEGFFKFPKPDIIRGTPSHLCFHLVLCFNLVQNIFVC